MQSTQKLELVKNKIGSSGFARVTFGPERRYFVNVVAEKRGQHEISFEDFAKLCKHSEIVRNSTLLLMKMFNAKITHIAEPPTCGCYEPLENKKEENRKVGIQEKSIGFDFLATMKKSK